MRILGIDPRLRTSGFGVIDAEGSELPYVASETILSALAASISEFCYALCRLLENLGDSSIGDFRTVSGGAIQDCCTYPRTVAHAVSMYR